MENAITFIEQNSLTGLKAGELRDSFLDIWMVIVEGRIFARSWGFAERSWYNTFLENPNGAIKCGATIYKIKAQIPADLSALTEKINEAYWKKYGHSDYNKPYVEGITQQAHIEKTMEFILLP